MRVMHVITNMMGSGGAEVMLSRLVSADPDPALIVPVMDVADRHRHLTADGHARIRPLQVSSGAGMLRAIPALARMITGERPDAVMCWLYHAMVVGQGAARLAGGNVPVYWNVRQSLDDPRTLTRSTRIALRMARHLSSGADGIVFNSSRALDLHRAYGFRNGNCLVIPNGFPRASGDVRVADVARVIGIAGRLHPQKDYETFFAAAAMTHRAHPEVRFVAAGVGLTPDNPAVAALIERYGLSPQAIALRGDLTDMASFYGEIDALVLSSRTEGFPNVVAEAMSYGKPAITTNVGDAARVVADTGFVVEPGRPEDLAEAMGTVLDLPAERYRALSAAARARIESDFSIDRIVETYRRFMAPPTPVALPLDGCPPERSWSDPNR